MTNGEMLSQKLYELRKKNQLSQEAFADKLGVSRQAVSKWELGESLPDTDNLITIAKLFGVSLDELVGNTVNQSKVPDEEDAAEDDSFFEDEDISHESDSDTTEGDKKGKTKVIIRITYALPYPILVTVAFLLWGFLADAWYVSWTLFLTIPVFDSLIESVKLKKFGKFDYAVLMVFIYLLIGMLFSAWHPYWVIFLTIPIYEGIAAAIDRN